MKGTQFVRTGCDFVTWYAATAAEDAAMIWDKAKQYGGFDLQAHGLSLLMQKGFTRDLRASNLEDVLAFNALQKVSRIVEALGHGQIVSLDSWRDLGAYSMIARRLREAKTWPA